MLIVGMINRMYNDSQPLPRVAVFVHTESLREVIHQQAGAVDLFWLTADSPRAAVVAVADAEARLLLVELDTDVSWLSVVRSDPATRRIPLIAFATTPSGVVRAHSYQAAQILDLTTQAHQLAAIIQQTLRSVVDATALATECDQPLPPLVAQGLHEFNAGDYFECHETLEAAWMHEAGPVRNCYRAILQIAVAYLQITRGNFRGAHKMFVRAVQWLAPLPARCHGIDIEQFRADAHTARQHLEALGEAGIAQFDRTLLKPIHFEARH